MDIARAVSSLGTISILENAQYKGLRSCAGSCLAEGQFLATDLVSYIGCGVPYYNTCFCNSNIVPQASSFISSCVAAACSEVADVPNAFSAWEGYCSSAGYPMANIAQTTIDTGTSGTAVPTTGQATVQTVAAPTAAATGASTGSAGSSSQSGSTSASSATSSQLNVGAIAGGAVGGVIVIGIVIIVVTMLILRDRRKRHAQALAPPQEQPPPTASFAPSVLTEKIPKTPVVTNNMPMWRAEENRQFGHELQGQGRMAPELGGWGNNRPRSNVPEMQA